jgi:glycosyltransferase involved in cell wall biosynthesis
MSYVQKELNSFVFIGRIADEVKNFSSLFNSWLELHENEVLNEEILYVCGMIPKDLLLNYNKRLNEINKPNIVQFLGDLQISELKKLLLKSDIFINVSLKEGSPISIQEAIKCKCALILPDISNFSEILCGKLGLIPVPINELNITKTLSKVISNKELLNEQREKQYKKYSNNTWAKFINIINE